MNIISYGAAGQVTGSAHLVDLAGSRFLFDCGLFQGPTKVDLQNLSPLGFDPKEIDFVLLSHAHLDHCGRLPLLVLGGFNGPIYTTEATRDLAELILLDSANVQSHQENPLYTTEDVEKTMSLFYPLKPSTPLRVKNLDISFHSAGHLLGASWIKVHSPETILVFSGDMGRYGSPFYHNPENLGAVDVLLLESTNGGKFTPKTEDGLQELYSEIKAAYEQNRTILIPAFSIGRTEEVLAGLSHLAKSNKDEDFFKIPFYVDSALAQAGLKVYKEYKDLHRMSPEDLNPPNLHLISREESFSLDKNNQPKVFLSASGMMEGGHILHHASTYLPDPSTLLLFVGYQGEETLGRRLLEGDKTVVIGKSPVEVNAEIKEIRGLSGHGDQDDLLHFVSTAKGLKTIILLHGEDSGMRALEEALPSDIKVLRAIPEVNVLEREDET